MIGCVEFNGPEQMNGSLQQPSPNLTALRVRAGLTVSQLARAAGVARGTVQAAERGSVPMARSQVQIAAVLGVDVFELWPLVNGAAA